LYQLLVSLVMISVELGKENYSLIPTTTIVELDV
jgi:hypothetical protein